MHTTEPDSQIVAGGIDPAERPVWREDLIAAITGAMLVAGLYLDGWNHINLQDGALGGFFTRWHALLYIGFTAAASWVLLQNSHLYRPKIRASPHLHRLFGVPLRFPFAVAGIFIASLGMLGDIAWHEIFGDERGVARVIAPFHLVLFTGAALLISAPVRSAWFATTVYPKRPTFVQLFPALLALTMITSAIAFMFQWLSAFVDWSPSLSLGELPPELTIDERVVGTVEFAGVARVLVTNLVLTAPLLIAIKRWILPFGSATLLFTGMAALMSSLTEFRSGWTILGAIVGGVVADVAVRASSASEDAPVAVRIVAAATPAATWITYFVVLSVAYGTRWPFDLWAGTVGLCVVTSLVLSILAVPPQRPAVA